MTNVPLPQLHTHNMAAHPPQLIPFLISLLAIPTMFSTSRFQHEPAMLFSVAVSICLVAFAAPFFLFRSLKFKPPFLFYIFTFFAFACVVDAILAATSFGWINLGLFYLENGERHLRGSHGAFINTWDATLHYACYLFFTNAYLRGAQGSENFRKLALFWAGSVVNSLAVMLPAVATGRYANHIEPSILLNVPFILLPIWFATKHFSPSTRAINVGSGFMDVILGILLAWRLNRGSGEKGKGE